MSGREPVTGFGARARLDLIEATQLAAALTQSIADTHGIRLLLLKGSVLAEHGLRPPRASSDIDILVEPGRVEEFRGLLEGFGWMARPTVSFNDADLGHALSFFKDGWPCDIDLHSFWPGFLAEPGVAFDALWARRVSLLFAHQRCQAVDRLGGILVLALHILRSNPEEGRHRLELGHLLDQQLDEDERRVLGELAIATGSAATAGELLRRLGVRVEPSIEEEADERLTAWVIRTRTGSNPFHLWRALLARTPWSGRPALVARALWPTSADIRAAHPTLSPDRGAVTAERFRRLGRGLRHMVRRRHLTNLDPE